jgi:hypothetical protein
MDPYLEQYWGDVHVRLINNACSAIQRQLPSGLVARMGERVCVEPEEGQGRNIIPDVRLVERWPSSEPKLSTDNGIAVAEPLIVHLVESEPMRQGYIEIIDIKTGRKVVTVIEVLSPSNKVPGPGRDLYVKKQEELKDGKVSLVEIDLLRAGRRVLSAPFDRIPEGHRTPYAACVRRGWKPSQVEFYRIPLRERLPAIRIPLRQTDTDIALDLQALIDQAYDDGRYGDDIDYREDADPPLSEDDARWADALLHEQRRR